MTANLCQKCQSIFVTPVPVPDDDRHVYQPRDKNWHHASIALLKEAAQSGCRLCELLWDEYTDYQHTRDQSLETLAGPDAPVSWELGFDETGGVRTSSLKLIFKCETNRGALGPVRKPWLKSSWLVWLEVLEPVDGTPGIDYSIGTSTNSPAALDLGSSWLETCCRLHSQCGSGFTPVAELGLERAQHWVPSRLVHVTTGDREPLRARLVRFENHIGGMRYMTLSHCWGQIPVFSLLKDNLESLVEDIPLDKLTQTFRDALLIARHMKVPYIWIDSLCIIQDDMEDWSKEAASMGEVFSNGLLNIAATSGHDGRAGCFVTRTPRQIEPLLVNATWKGGAVPAGEYVIEQRKTWREAINNAPLNGRGWVLQECILSPRTLHFTKSQIIWQCRQHYASENYPAGLPKHLSWWGRETKKYSFVCARGEARPDVASLYDDWTNIVGMYSMTSLTKEDDKLPAISGIARRTGELLGDQYLAGLWRGRLLHQLCWRTVPETTVGPTTRLPSTYIAPSWSWASLVGRLHMEVGLGQPLLRVLDIQVTPATSDTYGQVISGFLTVRGGLVEVGWSSDGQGRFQAVSLSSGRSLGESFIYPNLKAGFETRKIHLLPVEGKFDGYNNRFGSFWEVKGIVLVPAREGKFSRVGAFGALGASSCYFLGGFPINEIMGSPQQQMTGAVVTDNIGGPFENGLSLSLRDGGRASSPLFRGGRDDGYDSRPIFLNHGALDWSTALDITII